MPRASHEPALPNLTVAQLEYLDAVLHAPTWAQAAHGLGVSPSALSQGIAELERRLGVTLFERQGRRQVPTPLAAEVAAHAERVLAQTRDLARWAAGVRAGRSGRLRVGMIDAAAIDHYPAVLHAFRRERPEVDLHLAVAPSAELLGALRRGTLDLVVCVDPPSPVPDLELDPLVDEPLAVYAPAGVKVGPPRTWGPWVTFPAESHTRAAITRALRAEGARVEVVAESNQPEVLREMVRLGLGWTVLPVAGAEREPAPLHRARRRPLTTRRLVAARRAGAPPDPLADALLTELVAAGSERRP